MCQQIVITGRGPDLFCDNIGELEDALGATPIVDEGYTITPDWRSGCLCGVNTQATAKAYGLEHVGNVWQGEWSMHCELRFLSGPLRSNPQA